MHKDDTTTVPAPATLADFLALPEQDEAIGHIYCALGDSGLHFPADANELIVEIDAHGSLRNALYNLENMADQLDGAAADLRQLLIRFHTQRGTIRAAQEALEAFIASPTHGHRLALKDATEFLIGLPVLVPVELKKALQPFAQRNALRKKLTFHDLHLIAARKMMVDPAADVEAA